MHHKVASNLNRKLATFLFANKKRNFSMLLEMINMSEVREGDKNFKNAVDLIFDDLEKEEPEHFAVCQYKKYKLSAGEAVEYVVVK